MAKFESQLDLATQLDFSEVVLEAAVSKISEGYKDIGKNQRSLQVLDINQIKPPTKKRQRKVQGKENLKAKKKINKGNSVHERIGWKFGEMKKINKMKNIVPNFYF